MFPDINWTLTTPKKQTWNFFFVHIKTYVTRASLQKECLLCLKRTRNTSLQMICPEGSLFLASLMMMLDFSFIFYKPMRSIFHWDFSHLQQRSQVSGVCSSPSGLSWKQTWGFLWGEVALCWGFLSSNKKLPQTPWSWMKGLIQDLPSAQSWTHSSARIKHFDPKRTQPGVNLQEFNIWFRFCVPEPLKLLPAQQEKRTSNLKKHNDWRFSCISGKNLQKCGFIMK